MFTLAVAALLAGLFSLTASFLMTRASNLSAAWNIVIGGLVAIALALVLYLLVILIERAAFGS